MTDLVTPGEANAEIDSRSAGAAWENAGLAWIVDGIDIADNYGSVALEDLAGFEHRATNGLDVTLAGGEAYVAGWLVRDRETTVSLEANATERVYAGYDAGAILATDQAPNESENVIVGPWSAFDDGDPRILLYEFVTDDATVTSATDYRQLQKPVEIQPASNRLQVNTEFVEISGDRVATRPWVSETRFTAEEARAAVTAAALDGPHIELPNVDGHPDGILLGPDLNVAFSALAGDTVLYNLNAGLFRFRDYTGVGDLLRVDAATGDGWIRGGWEVDGGLVDNSEGDGVVPKVLGSGENLPSDTVPGRLVYDPGRET